MKSTINETMSAPCGMNCGICHGYLREKKKCLGCNNPDENKPKYCVSCRIKNCEELRLNKTNYCFACGKFPCARLKQLDKRYRTKYGMSMIENLTKIKETGISEFMTAENQKWTCGKCGEVICVHRDACLNCGQKNQYFPVKTP